MSAKQIHVQLLCTASIPKQRDMLVRIALTFLDEINWEQKCPGARSKPRVSHMVSLLEGLEVVKVLETVVGLGFVTSSVHSMACSDGLL